MMSTLREEVIAVITEICQPESPALTDDEKPLLESGLDSLDFAALLMALEDRYNVTFAEEDLDSVGSLRQIVGYLEGRVGR